MNEVFEAAIAAVDQGEAGLIVLQGQETVFSAATPGIRAALTLHDEMPELLQGAWIADRIIGTAAGMIFSHGGAAAIYGSVMSREAKERLDALGIPNRAGLLVEKIINRTGDGICPMEKAIAGCHDPEMGIPMLRAAVAQLMKT